MKIIITEYLENKNIYNYLALLSFFYILLKYIISYLINPDVDFILKIIIFSDIEYYDLVESFSRFDFFLNRSSIETSNKIFGFPFFSLIIHSIVFKLFGFYSFIILEIFFIFLLLIILFKILNIFFNQKSFSLTAIYILYSIVLLLELGIEFYGDNSVFKKIHSPIFEFIGYRFPRSLVTSIPIFIILYNALIIINKRKMNLKSNILAISLSLMFLANSFFYVFITLLLSSLIILNKSIFKNISNLLYYFIPIIFGLAIIFIQQNFSETDYEFRIGMYYINLDEKFFLVKHFLKKLTQVEILFLLISNSLLIFYLRKIKNETSLNHFDVIYITFLSSIISPFIFVIFSNKIISLYYFWTTIKFFGFFCLFIIILNFYKNIINYKIFIPFLIIFVFICSISNYIFVKKKDSELYSELNQTYKFLKKNYRNSNLVFLGLTNKFKFFQKIPDIIWLSNNNYMLMYPPGFSSTLKDTQLENLIFISLKSIGIDNNTFKKILNDDSCSGRSCFARHFTHKYSVNSLKYKRPLSDQYDKKDQKLISEIPPIIWWYLKINNSEKKRMVQKYANFDFEESFSPDLIMVDKDYKYLKFEIVQKNYKNVFQTRNHFYILKKIN